MPIQYPSYQINPQMVPDFKGRGDLLENIYKGYQMAQAPEQMAQQRRQADLNNQLAKEQLTAARYKNQIAPENQAASLANIQAQTEGLQQKNQYYPQQQAYQQLTDAAKLQDLQSKQGLYKSQEQLNTAKANQAMQPSGQMAELLRLRDSLPKNSQSWNQVNAAIDKAGQGSAGTTISYDENGRPIVSVGGSVGGRKGAGGLAVDENGNLLSMPTMATQTNLQGRITGEQLSEPYLNDIVQKLPQFQTAVGRGKLAAQQGSNYLLGTNFQGPSDAAQGQLSITNAAEGLMKAAGLNNTHSNLETLSGVLQPQFGESAQGYKTRIKNYMNMVVQNTNTGKRDLEGMSLAPGGVSGAGSQGSSSAKSDPLGIR